MLKLLSHVASPTKIARVPVYLIHYVTSKCNARCPHCFIFNEGDTRFAGKALSADEIDKMTRSMGQDAYNVMLTGGETFLRKDIDDITNSYLENTGTQIIQFFTNGWFEDRAYNCLEYFSRTFPKRNFVMVVSIDDLHEAHNDYRRLKDGFERAMGTYNRVKALNRPNIDLDIGLTVNTANEDRLDEIYDYLVKERGVRTLSCTLVRGDPLDPASKDVTLENYERFSSRLNEGLSNGELDCFKGFPGSDLLNAKSSVMRTMIPKTIAEGFQSNCYAGRLNGVIYANGDVYPCELLEDKFLGNLREFDYSLPELWNSPKAKEVRDWIWESRCHCTHECFMTTNILFNPRHYPKLLWEYAKIKLSVASTREGSDGSIP